MEILWLGDLECHNPARTGGKAANLSKLAATYPVPAGFCLPVSEQDTAIRVQVKDLEAAYLELAQRCGLDEPPVAVRSSAVDEDGQSASFAGQHETYLNVRGAKAIADSVNHCLESAYNQRALVYRQAHGLESPPRIAVLVQQLVHADVSAVVFSADPCRGLADQVVINATWGLGESLVSGTVTPDLYIVGKQSMQLLESRIGDKQTMCVSCPEGTREVVVPRPLRKEAALSAGQIAALAMLAVRLENNQGWAVDLECAFQGSRLYLLQCRPITTTRTALPAPLQTAKV